MGRIEIFNVHIFNRWCNFLLRNAQFNNKLAKNPKCTFRFFLSDTFFSRKIRIYLFSYQNTFRRRIRVIRAHLPSAVCYVNTLGTGFVTKRKIKVWKKWKYYSHTHHNHHPYTIKYLAYGSVWVSTCVYTTSCECLPEYESRNTMVKKRTFFLSTWTNECDYYKDAYVLSTRVFKTEILRIVRDKI